MSGMLDAPQLSEVNTTADYRHGYIEGFRRAEFEMTQFVGALMRATGRTEIFVPYAVVAGVGAVSAVRSEQGIVFELLGEEEAEEQS